MLFCCNFSYPAIAYFTANFFFIQSLPIDNMKICGYMTEQANTPFGKAMLAKVPN